jgi:arginyl-tRNA synthetase|tara:strand:+ start:229 stop:1965 length:1737 start_codon:yes stop_codon:yes gene_type:complete
MNIYKDYLNFLKDTVLLLKKKHKYEFDINDIFSKITLEPPKNLSHGDMSTNVAMLLAPKFKKKPYEIAEIFKEEINTFPGIKSVSIAGPGFLNIILDRLTWSNCLYKILINPDDWDQVNIGKGSNVNLEYISANPTGPLHAGHARGAVFGDALASLLSKVGFNVTKEYYINDAGSQIEKLVQSSILRYNECLGDKITVIPKGLYPGDYLKEVGKALFIKYNNKLKTYDNEEIFKIVSELSLKIMLDNIKNDLFKLGIEMDIYTSEQKIVSSDLLSNVINILERKKLLYKGILAPPKGMKTDDWETREQLLFKSSNYGDDTDRALQKSDGSWTYFATDMAYHLDKINRTNGDLINVLGADHTGYISRINAAVNALSDNKVSIDTKVCSLVNLLEDGKPLKMSKRAGTFVTLSDIIDAVGKDVLRFIMLTRRNDQSLDFDFKKVKEKSKDNPVFYVQYAYARCHSIFKAAETVKENLYPNNLNLLKAEEELNLIKFISLWPRILELAAKHHEPHRICFYLIELASNFHSLWNKGSDKPELKFIVDDNIDLTNARLCLVKAVALTISKGLNILKIEPINEM